jgi:hypothetical protein
VRALSANAPWASENPSAKPAVSLSFSLIPTPNSSLLSHIKPRPGRSCTAEVQRLSRRTITSTIRSISWNRGKIRHMTAFHSGREAKEFLISEIVVEAQRENVLLSELERKMLYFTESGWTLPDILKVSEDFDREYDQDKYEQKIAELVTNADKRLRKGSSDDYDRWWAAIRFLQQEDHYILVMIRLAALRPRGDQLA